MHLKNKNRLSLLFRALFLLIPIFTLVGCYSDPYTLEYTTGRPKPGTLLGRYVLLSQNVTNEGLAPFMGRQCSLVIKPDGTFLAQNFPNLDLCRTWDVKRAPGNFFMKLLTIKGVWNVDMGEEVPYGLGYTRNRFNLTLNSTQMKFDPVRLLHHKDPYELLFTLNDPEGGTTLIFQKAD